jgi:hypothetical protein
MCETASERYDTVIYLIYTIKVLIFSEINKETKLIYIYLLVIYYNA